MPTPTYYQHPLIPYQSPDSLVAIANAFEACDNVLYWFALADVMQEAGDN